MLSEKITPASHAGEDRVSSVPEFEDSLAHWADVQNGLHAVRGASLALDAMLFARRVHAGQVRKYTGNPYVDHLAEVAGIAMSVGWHATRPHPDEFMATCWLHDCVEDQDVMAAELYERFGVNVAGAVMLLSDIEQGNRAERKALSRARLAAAPGWVQTIKVADLISNTSSIVQNDPKFAVIYLEEKRLLLDVLTRADERLVAVARAQIGGAS